MLQKFSLFLFLLLTHFLFIELVASSPTEEEFTFNGFSGTNVTLDGTATVSSYGLLILTNNANNEQKQKGHAFHPSPICFCRNLSDGSIPSFSTTFVFAIVSECAELSGHGLAFVIAPSTNFSKAQRAKYLGLFSASNNGNATNHIVAIELDTILNSDFQDIDNNHVGIDINGLRSIASHTAGYYADDTGEFRNLTLISGEAMQVWVDYDGADLKLNVTLCPVNAIGKTTTKPTEPLISLPVDLATMLLDRPMYVGFSASTGSVMTSHYVIGWSFAKDVGQAPPLDYAKLPEIPRMILKGHGSRTLGFSLAVASLVLVLLVTVAAFAAARWRSKYAELREDWEVEFGPHRFSYRDLFRATNGFREKELLGVGGFGRVYKGTMPNSGAEVAVKRVSHESRQGMREFVAEIASIGRLRHRNIVQLLGYCRRKGELLLVYDFVPNGSLDKYLHDGRALGWSQRFRIIKGVATGLLYLHEEWEQVVVHRDIKASNVLLDGDMNAKLGDFGLARLYDHGIDPQTTHVVGTMGYLAPELARTGRATTATDVFAFGVFILEVACGRRPVEQSTMGRQGEQFLLVDWVVENWQKGLILNTVDIRLGGEEYAKEEAEMMLKLGLMCSHPHPASRPSMWLVVQYLEGRVPLLELSPANLCFTNLTLPHDEGFDDYIISYPSSVPSSSTTSGGR